MARRWLIAVALCVALVSAFAAQAWAEGVKPEQANEQQKQSARASFTTAMEAYNDKRFEEALEGFRRSYDTVASPNSHLMVARTLRSMGRTAEAYEEFRAVAEEG